MTSPSRHSSSHTAMKSATPATDQLVEMLMTHRVEYTVVAVHEPDRGIAAGVAPQQRLFDLGRLRTGFAGSMRCGEAAAVRQ